MGPAGVGSTYWATEVGQRGQERELGAIRQREGEWNEGSSHAGVRPFRNNTLILIVWVTC